MVGIKFIDFAGSWECLRWRSGGCLAEMSKCITTTTKITFVELLVNFDIKMFLLFCVTLSIAFYQLGIHFNVQCEKIWIVWIRLFELQKLVLLVTL